MNDPNTVILKNVRLSFADIFTAKSVNDGDPRFSCNFLLDKEKDAKQIDALTKRINALIREHFDGRKLGSDKVCLRDGDEKEYDGYAGCMFVSAANKTRPQVVDRDPSIHLVAEDGKPYPGCYVNGVIRLWVQNNNYGKRINASLEVVQFVRDGEPFGGTRVKATDILDVVEDEEDDFID